MTPWCCAPASPARPPRPVSSWCNRHILVDGNVVDRPSYRVKPGQTIQVKAKSQTMVPFQIAAEGVHRDVLPAVPVIST